MAMSREMKCKAFGAVLKDLEANLSEMNMDRARKRKKKPAAKAHRMEMMETEDDHGEEE
jgi:hypothetical protein